MRNIPYRQASLGVPSASSAFLSMFSMARIRTTRARLHTVLRRRLSYVAKRTRLFVITSPRSAVFVALCLLALLTFIICNIIPQIIQRITTSDFVFGVKRRISFYKDDDDLVAHMMRPGVHVPRDPVLRSKLAALIDNRVGDSKVTLWRRIDTDCPPEHDPPDPALYGSGTERCFAVGLPPHATTSFFRSPPHGDPAAFWQMNSRALCVSHRPMCLHGARMSKWLSFEPRGSTTCDVLGVERHSSVVQASNAGLNESCAAFRRRFVASIFGSEDFRSDYHAWETEAKALYDRRQQERYTQNRVPVRWVAQDADLVVVVPKYPWQNNICHYGRLWNFVLWTLRNLDRLGVNTGDQQTHPIKKVKVLFRARPSKDLPWHRGLREVTIQALRDELGMEVSVSHMRKDLNAEFQCSRAPTLWLGQEGRIDAFPFLNDTPVWLPSHQASDTHWPAIPHDSLWLRNALARAFQLPLAANWSAETGSFTSIPVPPRVVAVLQRSRRSRRRMTQSGHAWFEGMLQRLCTQYGMELRHVRVSFGTPFEEQVRQLHDVGISVGLHGANIVNSMFQPAGGALFEIFPWRYVRYYYAAGANSGLRYSFHEPIAGSDPNCSSASVYCAFRYREAIVYLTEIDRWRVYARLKHVFEYIDNLHQQYPEGYIPIRRDGNLYRFGPDRGNAGTKQKANTR